MKTSVSRHPWIVVLLCLQSAACFRSLDGSKVRCTGTDHCPTDYVCSAGQCISRFADAGAIDESSDQSGMIDSAAADTELQMAQPSLDTAAGEDVGS